MRGGRNTLPVFIFIGLALLAVIGAIVFGSAITTVSVEVNDTETETLSVGVYTVETVLIFGIAAVLCIVAIFFALNR